MTPDSEPLAETMRAELPAVIDEVIAEIGREVPEYARPLEGNFGRNVRVGVREALGRFVERVADPEGAAAHDPRIYVGLGRGEFREGRTLNALLQAYRVGARVAWRRLSAGALAAGADGERIAALAESVFAYIDELSAESAEGFAREQAASAGERQRLRERLVALLLSDPPAEPATLAQAAEEADWALTELVAVVAITEEGEEPTAVARRVGPMAIGVTAEGRGLVVLADPEGPGVRAALERALGDAGGAVGPAVPPAQARRSFERAAGALEVVGADGGLVVAEEHLAELLLDRDRQLASELAARALAPFDGRAGGPAGAAGRDPRRVARERPPADADRGGAPPAPADGALPGAPAARALRRRARRSRAPVRADTGASGA